MRRGALLGLVLLACGKRPVHEHAQAPFDPSPADFQRVVAQCVPTGGALRRFPISHAGTTETIALLDRSTAHVVADGEAVIWADGTELRRAARGPSGRWDVSLLTRSDAPIRDVAVTRDVVFWAAADLTGYTGIHRLDKTTGTTRLVAVEPGTIAPFVAQGTSVFWLSPRDGLRAVDGAGDAMTLKPAGAFSAPRAVVGADARRVYLATADGIVRVDQRPPFASVLVAGSAHPLVAASDGAHLYWLERGIEAPPEEECTRCRTGYEIERRSTFLGKLRRVTPDGSGAEDVVVDLPDVESLALHRGILWVGTAHGLLRIDPAAPRPRPVVVAAHARPHGAIATFGDALALTAAEPEPHVVLVASP